MKRGGSDKAICVLHRTRIQTRFITVKLTEVKESNIIVSSPKFLVHVVTDRLKIWTLRLTLKSCNDSDSIVHVHCKDKPISSV